jgi:hypothetical protein
MVDAGGAQGTPQLKPAWQWRRLIPEPDFCRRGKKQPRWTAALINAMGEVRICGFCRTSISTSLGYGYGSHLQVAVNGKAR